VFVDQFAPEAVGDAARIALSRKVEVVHDPAITALGAGFRHKVKVDVHFRDGAVATETREAPRGSEHSFAPAQDIVDKFRKLTRGVMPERQQDALVNAMLKVETLDNAKELVRLLRVET
jgi:aconitate decarboxylase